MSSVFKLKTIKIYIFLIKSKPIILFSIFLMMSFLLLIENAFSNNKEPRVSINGSGLKIPRMISLKNSLTYMRSGPGKEFPVKFEFKKKGYPLKIIAEYNNWRKVTTFNNITGWMHTQLLSSVRTGLVTKTTMLKIIPSNSGNTLAKLLPNLLIKIKKCQENWCKIEIVKRKIFIGWVKKNTIWGSTKN